MSQSRGEGEGKNTIELNTTVILRSMCRYNTGVRETAQWVKAPNDFLYLDPQKPYKSRKG